MGYPGQIWAVSNGKDSNGKDSPDFSNFSSSFFSNFCTFKFYFYTSL